MNRLLCVLIIVFIISNGLLPISAESVELSKAEEESRIGHLFDLYMTESFIMLRDESLFKKIQKVVNRIINAVEKQDGSVRLRIINDQLPIVSSFPGYVYVSSGMLDILESESELAYVIAHAIAHAIKKDQIESYIKILKKDRLTSFALHMMPFMFYVGGVAAAGSGLAAIQGIAAVESGVYSATTLGSALTAFDIYEFNNNHNLFVPYINLPDTKQKLSVIVFLSDVYIGYGEKEEIHADNMAISYLAKAGYDNKAIVPVLDKLKEMRNNSIVSGEIYHLLLADPGLEKRINNAEHILENY